MNREPAAPRQNGGSDQRRTAATVALLDEEVHVWKASISRDESTRPHSLALLSSDERDRAARFAFDSDRNRFVVSRAILRMLLARYLGMLPREIVLVYDSYGKPSLSTHQNPGGVSFNLAHSGDCAVYAFARRVQVGIDIERQRSEVPVTELAERFFSPRERNALRALPDEERREAFFRCWTRKEAYLKALGQGLSVPLDKFTVSVNPVESPLLLESLPPDTPTDWTILDLPVEKGVMAALAVRLKKPRVKFGEFQF